MIISKTWIRARGVCAGILFFCHQTSGDLSTYYVTNPSRAEGCKGGGYDVNKGCCGGAGAGSGR